MPYPGIDDPESIAKMDRCVEKVMAEGHDKSSAIAICRVSIMGKEIKMPDTTFKASDKLGDYLIVEDPKMPTTWHLQVRKDGKVDHGLMGGSWAALHEGYRGNKYEGPNKGEAIAKLRKMYEAEGMHVPGGKSLKEILVNLLEGRRNSSSDQGMIQQIHDHASALGADCPMVMKQADGKWRWVAISSNAYRDRDTEIVSTKALEDDCARADIDGYYGPLRFWHLGEYDLATQKAGPGVDIGDCDFNAMHGRILIESGTFRSEAIAKAVSAKAKDYELSIGFFHPSTEPDGDGVYRTIRRFERSLLPKGKAANPLTALPVITKETTAMQKQKLEALTALLGDDLAASIVQQADVVQKAADAAGVEFKQASEVKCPACGAMNSADAKKCEKCGAAMPGTMGKEAKTEPAPVQADAAALKELADQIGASLAPIIKAEVGTQLAALETKAAEKDALAVVALKERDDKIAILTKSVTDLDAALKALTGDLPRGVLRAATRPSEAAGNVISDEAKIKQFDPQSQPLGEFSKWLTSAA